MTFSFEVDINDLRLAFRTAEVVPYEQARGPANGAAIIRIGEYRRIEDGVIASIYDQSVLQPYYVRTIRRNHISFSFVREGDYSLQLSRQLYLTKGSMARMTIAEDSVARHIPRTASQKLAGVTVFVEANCLAERFGLDFDKLPEEFRNPPAGATTAEFSMEISLPPWSWIAIEQIFECRFEGVVRSAFMRAKVTELLCEAIAYLNQLDRPTNNFRIPAARREQTRIETAALIYRRDMRNPPSLRELAQRLGLNRNKLNAGFREMFGLTPHEYSRRVRLEWAHERISSGAMTISEACDAVGYASHSAFTRAYGEVFGYAPSETPGAGPARRSEK